MTAAEIFESVMGIGTEDPQILDRELPVGTLKTVVRGKIWAWSGKLRRVSKYEKGELDFLRIAETRPEMRRLIPSEIVEQLQ
jgi:hypothetical protein